MGAVMMSIQTTDKNIIVIHIIIKTGKRISISYHALPGIGYNVIK